MKERKRRFRLGCDGGEKVGDGRKVVGRSEGNDASGGLEGREEGIGREEVDSAGTLALALALASIVAGLAPYCLGGPGWRPQAQTLRNQRRGTKP